MLLFSWFSIQLHLYPVLFCIISTCLLWFHIRVATSYFPIFFARRHFFVTHFLCCKVSACPPFCLLSSFNCYLFLLIGMAFYYTHRNVWWWPPPSALLPISSFIHHCYAVVSCDLVSLNISLFLSPFRILFNEAFVRHLFCICYSSSSFSLFPPSVFLLYSFSFSSFPFCSFVFYSFLF